jgi:hypothetical protein
VARHVCVPVYRKHNACGPCVWLGAAWCASCARVAWRCGWAAQALGCWC